jgi:glutamate synthase domain-containing protein 3
MVAEDTRAIMAKLGFRRIIDMIGRTDVLQTAKAIDHWKADGLDLTPILAPAKKPHERTDVYCTREQDHGLNLALDNRLIAKTAQALKDGKPMRLEMPIVNTNRTVGTMLSHELVKKWGERGLNTDTIHIKFDGSAGQSFGAFLARGITLELEGDSNDYVGKGLSGGRLIIYPPRESTFVPEDNVIIGNVALYGATGGRAFFRGQCAERFCVRNSGARAVIEGVGDHACEYMTGGRAVILGPTGLNFAAGMSGGVAYVWDRNGDFSAKCNMGTVDLEAIENDEDIAELRGLIELHKEYTGSTVAERVLDEWPEILQQFVKVMPTDYKRVLAERKRHDEEMEAEVRDGATSTFAALRL